VIDVTPFNLPEDEEHEISDEERFEMVPPVDVSAYVDVAQPTPAAVAQQPQPQRQPRPLQEEDRQAYRRNYRQDAQWWELAGLDAKPTKNKPSRGLAPLTEEQIEDAAAAEEAAQEAEFIDLLGASTGRLSATVRQ
jgi:hypothetical protein